MKTDRFTFRPVRKNNWSDFVKLFESKGGPDYCWCMPWREIGKGQSRNSKSDKKQALKTFVDTDTPIGLLCYDNSEPIGWCSIAPRSTYRPLGGDESKENVWSLACFFIKKTYRKEGISKLLLKEAISFAKDNGADYLEAYPVEPDSPSYRFMGFVPLFEKHGFEFVKKAGKRRNVMLLKL